MTKKYPLALKTPSFLHGADYNPEQWLRTPEILDEDIRLMKLAHCNVMSVGIFSWASLEPEEGHFEFDWLDRVLDRLGQNGISAILATPSGARPAWMSQKYPEVLRVEANRVKNLHGFRHNHCFSSPVYREKCRTINRTLAERYKVHPAVILWHVSNEYGGACHCDLCQDAFRQWLRERYHDDLDALNHAWWTSFWSHNYTDWSQIESPAPHGEMFLHGLSLDWKRFVSDQMLDFYRHEIAPLREVTPNIPITTNFHGDLRDLNYWKFAPEVDVISWDMYPTWHNPEIGWKTASQTAFVYDLCRSFKQGQPFLLMESTPSVTNWQPVAKLKRPGMHLLSSLQAVAHGANSIQYFQWRKSRGSFEKFHGAVVDHCGHEHTRVFRDVTEVGQLLSQLDAIPGSSAKPEVALIFDWENRWAIEDAAGPRIERKDYLGTCIRHYNAFWSQGVSVDVIDMESDFSSYKLLVAPMLYMLRPGVARRIEEFVENGGRFVATYWSGIVDENDLCFLGGFPGPLRNVLGIWSEELDVLYDRESNSLAFEPENSLGLGGEYAIDTFCDLIHIETAQLLASYKHEFYAGRPALTVNHFGSGQAYYIASRNSEDFLADFYRTLIQGLELKQALNAELPEGVSIQTRSNGEKEFLFFLNFSEQEHTIALGNLRLTDMFDGSSIAQSVILAPYGMIVGEREI